MPVKPMEPPSFFNNDWYIEQKKLGKPDPVLADELFISFSVFKRWKRNLHLHSDINFRIKNHVKPKLEGKETVLKGLYLAGASYEMIAKKLHVSKETVRKELRKIGLRRTI